MNKEQCDVAEFHGAMNHGVEPSPTVPEDKIVRLRGRLVAEEFLEFLSSLFRIPNPMTFRNQVFGMIDGSPIAVDLPEMADAIADMKYVLEGTNLSFGIDGEPIWDAVHKANMTKRLGGVDEHGKQKKPPGWKPPDIAGILKAQGWKG
jgi:predicted HAD superfamily Cof-like phosphohydrolase